MGVHEICDRYVDDYAAADPVMATFLGISGYDDQLTDYSPQGYAARASIARRALEAVEAAEPADDGERAAKAMLHRLKSRSTKPGSTWPRST
jgi:hypothetical protein